MTTPVPEAVITAAAGEIYDLLGKPSLLDGDRGQVANRLARAALEVALPLLAAPVPDHLAAARKAAHDALAKAGRDWPGAMQISGHAGLDIALDAAIPLIIAAERDRPTAIIRLPELSEAALADLRERLADALAAPPRMVLGSPSEHSRIVAYRIGGRSYHPADVQIITEPLPEAPSIPVVPTEGTTP